MSEKKEEKNVTVRFDPDFHKRVKLKVVQDGVASVQSLVMNLLEQWLDGELNENNPEISRQSNATIESRDLQNPQVGRWLHLVEGILMSGHVLATEAIIRNIQAFDALIRADQKKKAVHGRNYTVPEPKDLAEQVRAILSGEDDSGERGRKSA